jgi:FMN phosphatase YigB (HAD superfamily)
VLVSDALRAVKPSKRAFQPILRADPRPERVLFLDDRERNVRCARELGLHALQVTDAASLVEVDQRLSKGSPETEGGELRTGTR